MKKSIYSLTSLRKLLADGNRRYLEFISEIDTPEVGVKKLTDLTQAQVENNHRYKGFNLLSEEDATVLRVLLRGEFTISGFTARQMRPILPDKNAGQISRLVKRLRVHGLIKKIGRTYKYYLTQLGRQVAVMALKLRELYVIPALAQAAVA
jgi:hypothetical protein